jgi:formylglycine-generating enzyme required for sulfatase activity
VANPDPRRQTVWLGPQAGAPANLAGSDPFPGMAPVGSFPEDKSPYGVLDLAGNVAEWTRSEATDPEFSGMQLAAGGTWDAPPELGHQAVDWVNNLPSRRFDFSLGLRCVAHPESAGALR